MLLNCCSLSCNVSQSYRTFNLSLIKKTNKWKKCYFSPEAYLEPSPTSAKKVFCENSQQKRVLAVNFFRKTSPSQIFDWVPNTPLLSQFQNFSTYSHIDRFYLGIMRKKKCEINIFGHFSSTHFLIIFHPLKNFSSESTKTRFIYWKGK